VPHVADALADVVPDVVDLAAGGRASRFTKMVVTPGR